MAGGIQLKTVTAWAFTAGVEGEEWSYLPG
jgi:hypothetical protein